MKRIQQKPKWFILGAGAMGSLWAVYFLKAGFQVTLISRSARTDTQLRLKTTSTESSFSVSYKTPEQLNETIDYLLLSTKAQQTTEAVKSIKAHIGNRAYVLVLQNGMSDEQLVDQLPGRIIFTAVTTDGAYLSDRQTVVHAGKGQTLIGGADATINSDQEKRLLQCLPTDYLDIVISDTIKQQQWKKLAVNCAVNGLTAIHQCRNGQLLTIDDAHQRLKKLCGEIVHIMHALQITVFADTQSLYNAVVNGCTITADNYSSMYQDIKHQRPTEIDCINGYLCEKAEQVNVACPENKQIIRDVKNLERAQL